MVLSDLDRKSKQVLEAVYEHGGDAQVGEVSDFTGIKSTQIHYRIDEKLEPGGLVESRKIDAEGPMGVKVVSLTDDGTEVVGQVLDGDSGPTVVEQVRELRAVVEDVHDSVQSFGGRVDHVEEMVEEVKTRAVDAERAAVEAQESAEEVEALRERVEELEEHPIEDKIDAKMAELRQVASRVEDVDAMNRDVRQILSSHGLIEATTKDLKPKDVDKSDRERIERSKNSPIRQTPQRDGYTAGDVLRELKE